MYTYYVLLCVRETKSERGRQDGGRRARERQDGRRDLLEDDVTEDWSVEETTGGLNKQWRNAVDLT